MSRNENAGAPPNIQTNQQNLSIRRGISRYQQSNHGRGMENNQGIIVSRNELQQNSQQSVKLIGKNSLHMKRRSEYPDTNKQWHLPQQQNYPNNKSSVLIQCEASKNAAVQNFNFAKVGPQAQAGWSGPAGANQSKQNVTHSQSSTGVSQSKRIQNQSVGQLSGVKQNI